MIIENEKEFKALQEIGRICALTRDEMAKNAVEGITTLELDLIGKKMLDKYGAESAPKKEYNFHIIDRFIMVKMSRFSSNVYS